MYSILQQLKYMLEQWWLNGRTNEQSAHEKCSLLRNFAWKKAWKRKEMKRHNIYTPHICMHAYMWKTQNQPKKHRDWCITFVCLAQGDFNWHYNYKRNFSNCLINEMKKRVTERVSAFDRILMSINWMHPVQEPRFPTCKTYICVFLQAFLWAQLIFLVAYKIITDTHTSQLDQCTI